MGFFEALHPLALAAVGTGFTFLMTAAGAAMVFFLRNGASEGLQRIFLGFAAGVMIAASVWSLLIPAIELGEATGMAGWLPAAGGFVLGVAFLLLLDVVTPHLHPGSADAEGPKTHLPGSTLMVLAVTLHNIPEGMAVGLACAMAASGSGSAAAAAALCIGMGLQNFPEGAAVSLPLKRDGFSSGRAFLYGAASGFVEPVGGMLAVLAAGGISLLMPWFLSFAAGAMMYVVVEELIPEAHLGEHSNSGTVGALLGFLLMMILDVALG
jgi:ZIP family zinc transporter